MILSLDQLRSDYKYIRKSQDDIAFRLDVLILFTKIDLEFKNYRMQTGKCERKKKLAAKLNISVRSLYRWKSEYRKFGLEGLRPIKNEGRKARELPARIKLLIKNYRKTKKWGAEIIQAYLRIEHDFDTSKFRIERYLSNSGLRDKYPCTTIKKQKAKKKSKHTKVVRVFVPGEHTQMDVKYLPHTLPHNQKCYVYNFIDHASNWSYKKVYSRFSAENTERFMNSLLNVCPFKICRIQTDNGSEFTFKWMSKYSDAPREHPLMSFCRLHNISHKLVPPGEKELQGLVERSHRQDDQELYSHIEPDNLEDLERLLENYWIERNETRRFKKLNWITPDGWLDNFTASYVALGWNIMEKKLIKQAEKIETVDLYKTAA